MLRVSLIRRISSVFHSLLELGFILYIQSLIEPWSDIRDITGSYVAWWETEHFFRFESKENFTNQRSRWIVYLFRRTFQSSKMYIGQGGTSWQVFLGYGTNCECEEMNATSLRFVTTYEQVWCSAHYMNTFCALCEEKCETCIASNLLVLMLRSVNPLRNRCVAELVYSAYILCTYQAFAIFCMDPRSPYCSSLRQTSHRWHEWSTYMWEYCGCKGKRSGTKSSVHWIHICKGCVSRFTTGMESA